MAPELIRNAPPKPLKGEYRLAHKQLARDRKNAERKAMEAAKRRDKNKCRWPGCRWKDLRIDAAHIFQHRGSGGNPDGSRTSRQLCAALCLRHHQLLDRKDAQIDALTDQLADGPLSFAVRDPESGLMLHVFSEKTIGVSVERSVR